MSAPVSKTGRVVRPSGVRILPPPYLFRSRPKTLVNKLIYKSPWYVYIAECKDKTLYVGIALDADKRIKAHNTTKQCRYTRFRQPINLVYKEICPTHGLAAKREAEIKSFDRKEKLALFRS